MCGIAGIIDESDKFGASEYVTKMLLAQQHRGPDHVSSAATPPGRRQATLGSVRLSINDKSARGLQPFSTPGGEIWGVINGEIYNWRSLRDQLAGSGHRFHSDCDAEIVPYLFLEYGPDFVKHINGMFAVAIWDDRERVLTLARDRMGEKPLFYSRSGSTLIFASEIRAMATCPLVDRSIDLHSISEFFTFRCVPYPNTLLSQVKRVPPGSLLRYSPESGALEVSRYWMPDLFSEPLTDIDLAADELGSLVTEAVRLRSDPGSGAALGVTLSGGVDSSTIAAMTRRHVGGDVPLDAFTTKVDGDFEDEEAISQVCGRNKLTLHETDCSLGDIGLVHDIVRKTLEPVGAGMIVPAYQSFRTAANRHHRVLLSGEGSDELFAGYSGRLILDSLLLRWPVLRDAEQRTALAENPQLSRALRRQAENPPATDDPLDRYVWWDDDNAYDAGLRHKILDDGIGRLDPLERLRQLDSMSDGATHENRMLWLETQLRLEAFMLPIVDRSSMATSVESRAPLLDPSIVEFAYRVPAGMKLRHGREKYILRHMGQRMSLLPGYVLWQKKHPFSGPISIWMENIDADLAHATFSDDSRLAEFLDMQAVRQIRKELTESTLSGYDQKLYSDILFGCLILAVWLDSLAQVN
ncbi:asparagine synthase (glutamine-hydrolyzing) [Amycolatopsis pithecellobii]|uniref:asparagine synthase (glutamine-hydrolyzing) n=1 Tax=Amycolatopsis pithecellobii TaxID=664692 RepID=A0A6N7Z7F0_9PSEU|nr:asparagine synthase (glutamine-hydrolyzing) [Amycolatopsis pithecellobii]MTD57010.1 asparagine synthase (glutamine-hydrolyzing) [Amycolatopsis pithecellobii]